MNLRSLKWHLNAIVSPFGVILNILLFFMIKYRSTKNLENFKKILYMGCLTDIVYGTILAITQPSVSIIDGVYFVFTEGIAGNFPHLWSTWTLIPNIFIMYFAITNAPIQFLYRYLLLCWDIELSIFAFFGLIGISVISISYFCYIWVDAILTRGFKDELFYSSLLNGTDWIVDGKLPNYGTFPFREKIFGSGWVSIVIISFSYGIVWFCAISIFIKLKKFASTYTQIAMKHQKQISIVLFVEALTPFITIVIPLTLDIIILILDVYLYWAGQAITLISSFSPPINAIVKLTVISCYRQTILDVFYGFFEKQKILKCKKVPLRIFTLSEKNSVTPKQCCFNNVINPLNRSFTSRSNFEII